MAAGQRRAVRRPHPRPARRGQYVPQLFADRLTGLGSGPVESPGQRHRRRRAGNPGHRRGPCRHPPGADRHRRRALLAAGLPQRAPGRQRRQHRLRPADPGAGADAVRRRPVVRAGAGRSATEPGNPAGRRRRPAPGAGGAAQRPGRALRRPAASVQRTGPVAGCRAAAGGRRPAGLPAGSPSRPARPRTAPARQPEERRCDPRQLLPGPVADRHPGLFQRRAGQPAAEPGRRPRRRADPAVPPVEPDAAAGGYRAHRLRDRRQRFPPGPLRSPRRSGEHPRRASPLRRAGGEPPARAGRRP